MNDKDRVVIVIHRTTHAALMKKRKDEWETFDATIRRFLKLPAIARRPPGPRPSARPDPGQKVKKSKGQKKGS